MPAGSTSTPTGGALRTAVPTLLRNALVPAVDGSNARQDVMLDGGKIVQLGDGGSIAPPAGADVVDCTERMLLPGFVNAHTHSVEHWARGLIKPLPLELWLQQLIRHEPRGDAGWCGVDSWLQTPASAIGLSAMMCGAESLLSGCTVIMDHLLIRDLDDLAAAVSAYKAMGIRAFIAPMLGDDAKMYENYIPLASDAPERNAAACAAGCPDCGAMGPNGTFRTKKGDSDPAKTKAMLELWEAAVEKFHDPEHGINIVIGPVTAYSASEDLLRGAAVLRRKHGLVGHIHLLETRGQALQARQFLPTGSAVKYLHATGFLQVPGTSCAHCVWLDDDEMKLMAESGASVVHNPLSNLRLGSGVAPLSEYAAAGVNVAMGCDGACSSDGQDLLESLKLGTILQTAKTPEYRDWPGARYTALQLGAANGYTAVGMKDQGGVLEVGAVADVTLWDLSSLALLPKTDPLSLLILGSRTQAVGAGSTLTDSWVRGVRVVCGGSPCGVDLPGLRRAVMAAQPDYRNTEITDPRANPTTAAFETEYRAALELDGEAAQRKRERVPGESFPQQRVLYDSSLLLKSPSAKTTTTGQQPGKKQRL